jgi:hypothetical protein
MTRNEGISVSDSKQDFVFLKDAAKDNLHIAAAALQRAENDLLKAKLVASVFERDLVDALIDAVRRTRADAEDILTII